MYEKGYNRLFWGILITIFHINIGYISIIPDFVGYMLIYSGLNVLSTQHEIYKNGKIPSILLVLLTLKDIIYDLNSNILVNKNYTFSLIAIIISSIVIIIKLYVMYVICSGIYELSKARELDELIRRTSSGWKEYLFISAVYLVYAAFSINLPATPRTILLVTIVILQAFITISMTLVFRKCKNTLKE